MFAQSQRRFLSRVTAVLMAVVFGAALGILPGCGVLSAPVSVPAAIAGNGLLGLHGRILDERGNPLDDVLITVKRRYVLWHANGTYPEYGTKTFISSHELDIPQRRAASLEFSFHKDGYQDVPVVVNTKEIDAGREHWTWPRDARLDVIMPKIGAVYTMTYTNVVLIEDMTDPAWLPSTDLTDLFGGKPLVPPGSPAHKWYVTSVPRPLKTTGPNREIDPLDINLPASLTFHLDDGDDGLLLTDLAASTNPLLQAPPDTNYPHEFTLTAERLRRLRAREGSKFAYDRSARFYFRVAGHRGFCVIVWPQHGLNTEWGRKIELEFHFYLMIDSRQPG